MKKEDFALKIDGKIIGKENYLTLRFMPVDEEKLGNLQCFSLLHKSSGKVKQLLYKLDFYFDWNENRIEFKTQLKDGDELRVMYLTNGEASSPSLFHYFGVAKKNDAWTQENKFSSMFE